MVVQMDGTFTMGFTDRCDKLFGDLNQFGPNNTLGGSRGHADLSGFPRLGCKNVDDITAGSSLRVPWPRSVSLVASVFLRCDKDETDVDEPFRPLVAHLMWLANKTRPDILNAVRVVAKYSAATKLLRWQAALHIVTYIEPTSTYRTTIQRGG